MTGPFCHLGGFLSLGLGASVPTTAWSRKSGDISLRNKMDSGNPCILGPQTAILVPHSDSSSCNFWPCSDQSSVYPITHAGTTRPNTAVYQTLHSVLVPTKSRIFSILQPRGRLCYGSALYKSSL